MYITSGIWLMGAKVHPVGEGQDICPRRNGSGRARTSSQTRVGKRDRTLLTAETTVAVVLMLRVIFVMSVWISARAVLMALILGVSWMKRAVLVVSCC